MKFSRTVIIALLTMSPLANAAQWNDNTPIQLDWRQANSQEEIAQMCSEGLGGSVQGKLKLHVNGCFYKTDDNVCHVVSINPAVARNEGAALRDFGHEYKHCVDGYFHDDVQRTDLTFFKTP